MGHNTKFEWQQRIVSAHVEPFLRGLIHSDGTRIIAVERKGAHEQPLDVEPRQRVQRGH
jgi:hypothetical protein